jgi:hypothetical protein
MRWTSISCFNIFISSRKAIYIKVAGSPERRGDLLHCAGASAIIFTGKTGREDRKCCPKTA